MSTAPPWVATKKTFRSLLRILRRFLANSPRNEYEGIVFIAIRSTANVFGKV